MSNRMSNLRPGMDNWMPTRAVSRAIVLIVVLLAVGIVLGRVDLVALGAPFVIGTTLAMRKRPVSAPEVALLPNQEETDRRLVEGDEVGLELAVTNRDRATYDLVLLEIPDSGELDLKPAGRTVVIPVPGSSRTAVPMTAGLHRWGRPTIGAVSVRPVGAGGLLAGPSAASEPTSLKVYPHGSRFEAVDAIPNASGIVGVHPSRRVGEGGELADIRRFAPGDRLRRIDWRTSLRAGELHVVQTYADSDAQLAIVLDVLHDAGPGPTVLDVTVRAAAGIAEHYATRGDRVKLVEYGGRGRTLRAGSGPRHRVLAYEWLLDTKAGERRFGPSDVPAGRSLVPERALVVVLTPLLDERSVRMLASMARSRLSVVAIDTLPDGLRASDTGRQGSWTEPAFRLWMMERRNIMAMLAEHGVPVVRWEGAGSLDQVLRGLTRMAAGR